MRYKNVEKRSHVTDVLYDAEASDPSRRRHQAANEEPEKRLRLETPIENAPTPKKALVRLTKLVRRQPPSTSDATYSASSAEEDSDDFVIENRRSQTQANIKAKSDHQQVHSTTSMQCPLCDAKFVRNGWLRNHLARIHKLSTDADADQSLAAEHTPVSDELARIQQFFVAQSDQTNVSAVAAQLEPAFRYTQRLLDWYRQELPANSQHISVADVTAIHTDLVSRQMRMYDAVSQAIAAKRDALQIAYLDFVQKLDKGAGSVLAEKLRRRWGKDVNIEYVHIEPKKEPVDVKIEYVEFESKEESVDEDAEVEDDGLIELIEVSDEEYE